MAAKSPRVKHGKGPCVPPWLGMTKSFIEIPSQKSINSFSNQNHPVLAAKSPRVKHGKGPCLPLWLGMTKSFIKSPSQKSKILSQIKIPSQNLKILSQNFIDSFKSIFKEKFNE